MASTTSPPMLCAEALWANASEQTHATKTVERRIVMGMRFDARWTNGDRIMFRSFPSRDDDAGRDMPAPPRSPEQPFPSGDDRRRREGEPSPRDHVNEHLRARAAAAAA